MKKSVITAFLVLLLVAVCALPALAQTKVYRGSIGNSHIQMRLNFSGNEVTGTYAYDAIGRDLALSGRLNNGALELTELSGKQKTGKFVCKKPLDDPIDSECTWSKMDGTNELMVTLEEQYFDPNAGVQVTPKMIMNRRSVTASYPQITGSGALSAGAQAFNRRIIVLLQKRVHDFVPIDGKGVFETNYNILFSANDLISVEMSEYYDGGGAHPNNSFWSLTYDLKANKELKFEDLFNPKSDYNSAIAKYVVADIAKRADAVEEDDARRENRKPNKRDDPIVSEDQLTELSGWGMTPKGVVVYFDFPHVIAFFDRNFVPYSAIKQHLNPAGPAGRFQ